MKLIDALNAFVSENNIKNTIDADDYPDMAYLFFTSSSDLGPLQCGIQIDEESRYIMIYLIDFNRKITKPNRVNALERLNDLNLNTKIGGYQLFQAEAGEFIRYYLGFPADDVLVDDTVIYNLIAEGVNSINENSHDLQNLSK